MSPGRIRTGKEQIKLAQGPVRGLRSLSGEVVRRCGGSLSGPPCLELNVGCCHVNKGESLEPFSGKPIFF